MKHLKDNAIIKVITTEKSVNTSRYNTKIMLVDSSLNKIDIKKAAELLFGVKVLSVNTLNLPGKKKRMGMRTYQTSKYKKAYIKLSNDSVIDLSKGV